MRKRHDAMKLSEMGTTGLVARVNQAPRKARRLIIRQALIVLGRRYPSLEPRRLRDAFVTAVNAHDTRQRKTERTRV